MSETTTETTTTTPKTRKPPKTMADTTAKTATTTTKRRSLKDLFHDPVAVKIERAKAHQSFMVPGAGEADSFNRMRGNMKNIEMVYHPGYGLIGFNHGEYFLTPSANLVVAYENELKPIK